MYACLVWFILFNLVLKLQHLFFNSNLISKYTFFFGFQDKKLINVVERLFFLLNTGLSVKYCCTIDCFLHEYLEDGWFVSKNTQKHIFWVIEILGYLAFLIAIPSVYFFNQIGETQIEKNRKGVSLCQRKVQLNSENKIMLCFF